MLQMKMARRCYAATSQYPDPRRCSEAVYSFTVGPDNVYSLLQLRRQVQPGIDIEMRVAERRAAPTYHFL